MNFENICKDPYSAGLNDLTQEDFDLHNWLCDLAETRGYTEEELSLVSVGIWAALNMVRKIEKPKKESK